MPTRDTPQRRVRLSLHDRVCASQFCEGDGREDHAKRTQSTHARDIVRGALRDDASFSGLLHGILCLAATALGGCRSPEGHQRAMRQDGTVDRWRAIVRGPAAG